MKKTGSIIEFIKKEKVLAIAAALAVISMFFIHPNAEYAGYVNYRVLAILFCLMLVVKGFQDVGLFDFMTEKLFGNLSGSKRLCMLLIWLCFFSSMLITNDVALITFVPFTIMVLKRCHLEKQMMPVIVLQTMGANLGSMVTPIGNPQNLYLFSVSEMEIGEFFQTMLPLSMFSFVILSLAGLLLLPNEKIQVGIKERPSNRIDRISLLMYSGLFIFNILVVLHVVPWGVAVVVTVVGICILRKQYLLCRVDYALLLTFTGFFIFVGNMGRITIIRELLYQILHGKEILVAAIGSQFLSNVPAAILLSGFTDNYKGLLLGTNIGGLGTLIASMASLISYKLYMNEPEVEKKGYVTTFSIYNVIGLILLLLFAVIFYR